MVLVPIGIFRMLQASCKSMFILHHAATIDKKHNLTFSLGLWDSLVSSQSLAQNIALIHALQSSHVSFLHLEQENNTSVDNIWTDGWMEVWMDRWIDRQINRCILVLPSSLHAKTARNSTSGTNTTGPWPIAGLPNKLPRTSPRTSPARWRWWSESSLRPWSMSVLEMFKNPKGKTCVASIRCFEKESTVSRGIAIK